MLSDRWQVGSGRQLLASGMPLGEVARNPNVSVPTLYRWLSASARECWPASIAPDQANVSCWTCSRATRRPTRPYYQRQ
jgi:hypothetical protein